MAPPTCAFKPRNATCSSARIPVRDSVAANDIDTVGGKWKLPTDVPTIEALLEPPHGAQPGSSSYELVISEGCLAAWMEQGSPCCAAASLAGAFNKLRRLRSTDADAMLPAHVLSVLETILSANLIECSRAHQ